MTVDFVIRAALAALACGGLGACSELAYYHQAMRGHWQIVSDQQPIESLEASAEISAELRARLQRSSELRQFAVTDLALPDNDSYRNYVDLGRPFAVWSLFSAPEFSLQPRIWCYPVIGCLAYRGFFDERDAHALATALRDEGQEVWVGGVPAYSSLGWSNDPLLSTFIRWPDGRLAELIFHELAHQQVYVSGATAFNEAFATAVGQRGTERWLESRGDAAALSAYRQFSARRTSFLQLATRYRGALGAIYASDRDDGAKRQAKAAALGRLAVDYERWKAGQGGYSGYDQVIALGPNNGWFAAMATYHELVPAFEQLLSDSGDDFGAFYKAVESMGALPAEQRKRLMEELLAPASGRK